MREIKRSVIIMGFTVYAFILELLSTISTIHVTTSKNCIASNCSLPSFVIAGRQDYSLLNRVRR